MLPWQFVATGVSEASASLISKVYFPRLIVPAASVITSFADVLVSFVILLGLMAWYQYAPDWRILTLPFFIVLAVGAVSGPGVWLCALSVKYRDFRYVVPFVVQVGFYISPVGFSIVVVPEAWRLFYNLNPMVGVIEGGPGQSCIRGLRICRPDCAAHPRGARSACHRLKADQ